MITFSDEELLLLPNQGHCNVNYLLLKGDKKYHVRKYKLADRDRVFEYKVQKAAAQKGIAAKPLYRDKTIMIGEFIEGEHKSKLSRKEICQLAKALRTLHSMTLPAKKQKIPRKIAVKAQKFTEDCVLLHGDLSVKNILFNTRPMLIDWEYAGKGDRYFDLASVCLEFGFSWSEEMLFFRAYGVRLAHEKLALYKEMFNLLNVKWFEDMQKGKLAFHLL